MEGARQILTILATVALNVPALVPFCGPALAALTFSKKLTPTLEEMAPHSPFMSTMVGRRTTPEFRSRSLPAISTNIGTQDPHFFGELLVKLGRGPALDALFDSGANDLAAAVDSICASTSPPLGKANRINVACHHLNYFQCEAGISALKSLDWTAAESAVTGAPVVLLAFANDEGNHLDNLVRERKTISDALSSFEDNSYIRLHVEDDAGIDDLFGLFDRFTDQVAMFHYGGHADGDRARP